MTTARQLGFLLALLLATAHALNETEPIFRAVGGALEMGFCFGVDYIVVYRLSTEGKQLVGNSADASQMPPADLRGRVNITNHLQGLLGLEITNLEHSDSGVYKRECWGETALVNQHKHYLHVCSEEASSQEIRLEPEGGADLVCNISTTKLASTTIRWYREVYPGYNTTMFLDTKSSLEPVQADLRGLLQVRDRGIMLHIPGSVMKNTHLFYCMVMVGEKCLGYQNIHLPETEELDVKSIFRSVGEEAVVLPCSSQGVNQKQKYWETPFGHVNSTSSQGDPMYTLASGDDYSLTISSLTANHAGDYKCFSNVLVADYSLVVCPARDPVEVSFSFGSKVALECDPDRDESSGVQWYRHSGLEEDHLIVDSGDPAIAIPTDLSGRVKYSEADSSLLFTELTKKDDGMYWCVVLESQDYTDNEDYPESEDDTDENYGDYLVPEDEYTDTCLFRRVTNLRYDTKGQTVPGPEPEPEPEPKNSSALYAVCGAVIGCVILGSIGAVVGVKMRAKRKAAQTQRLELSGKHGEDIACTEPLEPKHKGP